MAQRVAQRLPGAQPPGSLHAEPPPPQAYGAWNGTPMSQMSGYRGLHAEPAGGPPSTPMSMNGVQSPQRQYVPNQFAQAMRAQPQQPTPMGPSQRPQISPQQMAMIQQLRQGGMR